MTGATVTDEMLMAHADGALEPAEAEQVARAVAADPELAARLEAFRRGSERLSALARSMPGEVPDAMIARVRELAATQPAAGATVVDLGARRGARQVPFWQLPAAAAACLATGVLATLALMPHPTPAPVLSTALDSALAAALDTQPSGTDLSLPQDGTLRLVSTFHDGEGALCREFELARTTTLLAVACAADNAWQLRLTVAAATGGEADYAPASGLETLDAFLGSIGADLPLDPQAEAAALRALRD